MNSTANTCQGETLCSNKWECAATSITECNMQALKGSTKYNCCGEMKGNGESEQDFGSLLLFTEWHRIDVACPVRGSIELIVPFQHQSKRQNCTSLSSYKFSFIDF